MPLRTSDFDYHLPPGLIAQRPLEHRDQSRLLIVTRDEARLEDRVFADFPTLLAPGDVLVLNTTRVRHARLLGTRPSGARAEVLLIHPGPDDTWIAMGKPGSALRPGKRIALAPDVWVETVSVFEDGNRAIRFVGAPADEVIRRFGLLPLPPYIDRAPNEKDEAAYQTVYADRASSVAAPTAGLHFTPQILAALEARGIRIARIELEVGPGTFKPVETEDLSRHPMHPERYHIPPSTVATIDEAQKDGGKIWAVGTTVVRALESAARDGTLMPGSRETSLMITPGYRFRVVNRLLTNFHLPRSTLLMLVSAFAGLEVTLNAYDHAVREGYRFYSYGDAMAIR